MRRKTTSDDAVRLRLDDELRLIREAIAVVDTGGSRRVVVAGLALGEAVLAPARALAAGTHARIVPLWSVDEQGLAIAVEAIAPGEAGDAVGRDVTGAGHDGEAGA